jgi:hypothetical protein
MKNNLLRKKKFSCFFYLYRFRKYASYGFPIINLFNPGVRHETSCIIRAGYRAVQDCDYWWRRGMYRNTACLLAGETALFDTKCVPVRLHPQKPSISQHVRGLNPGFGDEEGHITQRCSGVRRTGLGGGGGDRPPNTPPPPPDSKRVVCKLNFVYSGPILAEM